MSSDTHPAIATPKLLSRKPVAYDAFLSYSRHNADAAVGLQKGLHRIGRRPGRLHALRVFLDTIDLAASPNLWGRITEALDRSRYLIAVLSPDSAASEWVNKEVLYWLETRGPDNLLLVLAAGRLEWDEPTKRFDPHLSDAAPPVLTVPGVLVNEPVYVDVSRCAPWDLHEPKFREKATELAAPIHNKSKYELASDDVRERQHFRRLRRAAFAALAVLTAVSLVTSVVAVVQRRTAQEQRNQAVALQLTAQGESVLSGVGAGNDVFAIQLLLAAKQLAPGIDDASLISALRQRADTVKIAHNGPAINDVAMSKDGTSLVSGNGDGTVRLWDAATGQPIGEPMVGHQSAVLSVALSDDGRHIASGGEDGSVRLWDVSSRSPIHQPMIGHGWSVTSVAFSPDGHRIATGGSDGTVRLWSVDTGLAEGEPMTGDERAVYAVAFSPTATTSRLADTTRRCSCGMPIPDGPSVIRCQATTERSRAWPSVPMAHAWHRRVLTRPCGSGT